MKKHSYKMLCITLGTILMAGCGKKEQTPTAELENEISTTHEQEEIEEVYLPAEEDGGIPTIIVEYAQEEEYPQLAEFLAAYYQIPEEEQTQTRYYYNRCDLNEDGIEEIFVVVIGDYTQTEAGDPALLLQEKDGEFLQIEAFPAIRTPVTISENMTNGWHDLIFWTYGMGKETGYEICHYDIEGGYQTQNNEFSVEKVSVSGTQILSNNLIDDMDQGNYMTLKKQE